MPTFRARSASACLHDDGSAEVRFRSSDNTSVSVRMSEPALLLLAQQIAEIMHPPVSE